MLKWLSPSRARIRAEVREDDVLSTQIAYDPRWVATVAGQRVAKAADGLGHLYLKPGRSGPVELELRFRNPFWVQGIWLAALALALGAYLGGRKKSSRPMT